MALRSQLPQTAIYSLSFIWREPQIMTIKLSANGQEITLMKLDKPSGDLHSHLTKETKSPEKKGQDQLTNKTMPGPCRSPPALWNFPAFTGRGAMSGWGVCVCVWCVGMRRYVISWTFVWRFNLHAKGLHNFPVKKWFTRPHIPNTYQRLLLCDIKCPSSAFFHRKSCQNGIE